MNNLSGLQRFFFLSLGLMTVFGLLVIRMFWVQVVDGNRYREMGRQQYQERIILKAHRGLIVDRNNISLVTNQIQYSYGIDPYMTSAEDAPVIAKRFSKVFGRSYSGYLKKIRTKTNFIWLERGVSPEDRERLGLQSYPSIVEVKEPTRLYRYNEMAGQLLGYTNIDNKGISGLELGYDQYIRGKDGYVIMQRDGRGRRIPSSDFTRQEPVHGKQVETTLDIIVQGIVDEELRNGVTSSGGTGGVAIFMLPETGEIVAMSHYPAINPNFPEKIKTENARIRAVTDVFEPGSTFKLVTSAGAYEYGIRKNSDMINAENGTWVYKGAKVIDHEKLGKITFAESVIHSSNVAMAKTGLLLGEEKFYRMARNFGFGMETGIDLPGEIPGTLKQPLEWSGITLPWMAFGYEVLVTPLQILNAYAAIANRGQLLKPYVVSKVINSDGTPLFENKPMVIRQVVSLSTVDTLIPVLSAVVSGGTGKATDISSLMIAGKTGTAQKVVSGRYEKQYMASFVGFFPADRPLLAGIILIDSPKNGYYGGAVSAPIFGRIAKRILGSSQYLDQTFHAENLVPDSLKNKYRVPQLVGFSHEAAVAILNETKWEYELAGTGFYVSAQSPLPGTYSEDKEIHLTMTDTFPFDQKMEGKKRNLSARELVNKIQSEGYQTKVTAVGKVQKTTKRKSSEVATTSGTSAVQKGSRQ